MDCTITCVYGNNRFKDHLIYDIVYEFLKTDLVKFGAVLGKVYPYYEYISDNMYMKYDEDILKEYINNIEKVYKKNNGDIDYNLLIVDTNLIDLNTESWEYIFENYKIYKTNIIIIIDKIMEYNIERLSKYIDLIYILKQTYNAYDNLKNLYKTFFEKICDEKRFLNIYTENTIHLLNVLITDIKNNNFYSYIIKTSIPEYIFNTYKIYDEKKIYKDRCKVSDIINV
jgi:hypothetical protein